MQTSTLHRLLDSLGNAQRHHLAFALLDTDPARQSLARHQACKAGAILDAIRFELSARDARGGRSAEAALRADRYLQHLLADFLDLGKLDGTRSAASSPPARQDANARAGTGITTASSPNAESSQGHAQREQPRRQAGGRNG